MKYSVITFGCRVNQADSLAIEDELRARGATSAPPEDADVVVVNTCSVTAGADQGARQTIRRIARDNPDVRVIVTGCYATRRPNEVGALPNVLRIIGNERKDVLVRDLAGEIGLATAERYSDGEGPCGAALAPGVAGRTAMTLRVQTGCEEYCSYCIIPSTRGASRSRALAKVVADIRRAVDAGYKEVVITGVHLGSYGRDLGNGTSLTRLVRALAEWPDEVMFRISSLEPMDCSPEIVALVARSPRLAPHFHLPLQHGCDDLLRAMRRPYTADYYRRLVESIRDQVPSASIGSDIIVGFPGENADHVGGMLALLEQLPLTHIHVFPYSDRPGTVAAMLPGKVAGGEIRTRAAAVRAVGRELTRAFHASQVGVTRRALTIEDGSHVVTDNYLKLRIPPGRPRNQWVQVRIGGSPLALEADEVRDARSL
jgi:threonylcarbamoyladenosine tRNA methylthiotransferase MtaB